LTSEDPNAASLDLDLDEDLFDFDEASFDVAADDDYDLDEIFAAFEAADEEDDERDPFEPEPPAAAPEPAGTSPSTSAGPAPPAPVEPAAAEPAPVEPAFAEPAFDEPVAAAPPPAAAPAPTRVAPEPAPSAPVAHRSAPAPAARTSPPSATPAPTDSAPVPAAAADRGARDPVVVTSSLNRSFLWILVALVGLNATVALVVVKSTGDMRRSFESVGDDMQGVAEELADGAARMRSDALRDTAPITGFDAENHGTFDAALEEIENGEYTRARRRLYSLLAIVDRLDPDVREEVEGRANYLLAHARHLEGLSRLESDR